MPDIHDLIDALPKAELHLHLEGSLEPAFLLETARRNGVSIPYEALAEIEAAYRFSNLQDFLDIYYQGMSVLIHERDFFELTDAYLKRCVADNVRHVEVFFDPQGHTSRGVPFEAVIGGILGALDAGQRKYGITYRLIMCFLRHLSQDDAFETLEAAGPWLDRIEAVGLDSSEVGHPPSKFVKVFDKARAKGLRCVAHAGEEGPPDYVREALDLLRIERIDHGNRLLEDKELIARVRAKGLTLTVCPLSNVALRNVPDMRRHPLKRMLELGLRPTVNSDDPAYFGGYVGANYHAVADALPLDKRDIVTLAKYSFSGSFLPEETIERHLDAIDAVAAEHAL